MIILFSKNNLSSEFKVPKTNMVATSMMPVCDHPDFRALADLYLATNRTRISASREIWDTTNCDVCSWQGVTCISGRVTELRLFNLGLTGVIPESICTLIYLQSLDLARNQFTGQIPAGLSSLSQLKYLKLFNNQLAGRIPDPSLMINLSKVYLNNNFLVGHIPSGFGTLSNLEVLDLSHNQLTGNIPVSICNADQVLYLDFSDNQLEGCYPPEFIRLLFRARNEIFETTAPELELNLTDNSGLPFGGDLELPEESNYDDIYCINVTPECHPDYQALVDLYLSTNGEYWNQKSGWQDYLINCNVCTWQGVGCRSGRVVALNLANNNLNGTLPSSFSGLSNLENLNLNNNELNGTIPASIGFLTSLQQLWINQNNLSGNIPGSIGSIRSLRDLDASNNRLTGGIPSNLFGLSNLRILKLNHNMLSGSLPTDFRSSSPLQILYLQNNQFTETIPASLGALTSLRQLYLSRNRLSGEIPGTLGSLRHLSSLWLHENQLTGSIPNTLGSLSSMRTLYLNNNRLTGNIPSTLSILINLNLLDLSNNQLSGSIPATLGSLTNLSTLVLNNNQLSGCIPNELNNLCDQVVDNPFYPLHQVLGGNPGLSGGGDWAAFCATGAGSCNCHPDISALKSLFRSTDGNNWTHTWDTLDCNVRSWYGVVCNREGRVVELRLNNNNLVGIIPESIGLLSNLKYLSLSNNQLSGNIPTSLGSLLFLKSLNLGINSLSGIIPSSLGSLPYLNDLYLNNNLLSGNIPESIGSLSNLTWLWLNDNLLEGSIPNSFGSLSNIRFLWLYNNQLRGSIPESFRSLENLESLRLSNNYLTGTIPSGLGSLVELEELNLSKNRLNGCIPRSMYNLCNQLTHPLHWVLNTNPDLPGGGDFEGFCSGSLPPCCSPNFETMKTLYIAWGGSATLSWDTTDCSMSRPHWDGIEMDDDGYVISINLDDRGLTGMIPEGICILSRLQSLILSNNDLSGTIPECIDALSSIREINLDNNDLVTGSLDQQLSPRSIGGGIPESINKLKNLEVLKLSGNKFSGLLPASIVNLKKLRIVNLNNNDFSGCIPYEYRTFCGRNTQFSFFNNKGLLGGDSFIKFCGSGIGACDPPPCNLTCKDTITVAIDAYDCNYKVLGNELDLEATCPYNTLSFKINGTTNGEGSETMQRFIINPGMSTLIWTTDSGTSKAKNCKTIINAIDTTAPILRCVSSRITRYISKTNTLCSYTVPANNMASILGYSVSDCSNINLSFDITGRNNATGLSILSDFAFGLGINEIFVSAKDAADNKSQCSFRLEILDTVNRYITVYKTVCDTLLWNGRVLRSSGEYKHTVPNYRGCDSTTRLLLLVDSRLCNTDTCTIICLDNINIAASENCDYKVNGTELDPTVTGCTIRTLTYTLTGATEGTGINSLAGVRLNKDTTYVTWTVNGETSCRSRIMVVDKTPPVITCPSSQIRYTDINSCRYTVENMRIKELGINNVTDNCRIQKIFANLSGATTGDDPFAPELTLSIGVTTIKWTAIDSSGNIGTCNFQFTVIDTTPLITTINETSCEFYKYNNKTYTESGTYVNTFATSGGCDSTVTLNLTISQPSTWYLDEDGDGYAFAITKSCKSPGLGYSTNQIPLGDCNDKDKSINPRTSDKNCNGIDDDCDGKIDEDYIALDCKTCKDGKETDSGTTYYVDADGDGYGGQKSTISCTPPAGYVTNNIDCNDADKTINPGVKDDNCNGKDDDCDGKIDEEYIAANCKKCTNGQETETLTTFYVDADGDGFGNPQKTTQACLVLPGYVTNNQDCDDSNKNINPKALDNNCNKLDDDCDGKIDEGYLPANCKNCVNGQEVTTLFTYYIDNDGDGFGGQKGLQACTAPVGYVDNNKDCNDGNKAINPKASDNTCNNIDEDCDGKIDEDYLPANCKTCVLGQEVTTLNTFYYDGDGDGYGWFKTTVKACIAPKNYVALSTDCDDNNKNINPGAKESCLNNTDDDCDGKVNDGCLLSPDPQYLFGPGLESRAIQPYVGVYPNPTNGLFTVRLNQFDIHKETIVSVYSAKGIKLFETISLQRNSISINMQNRLMPPGIYILQVQNNKFKYQQKIILN